MCCFFLLVILFLIAFSPVLCLCGLQSEYEQGLKYNVWQRKIDLPGGQHVIMHNAQVIVDYAPPSLHATLQQLAEGAEQRPRVVQRGLDENDELEDGESLDIEHVVFVVNGIGGGEAQRNIVQHGKSLVQVNPPFAD